MNIEFSENASKFLKLNPQFGNLVVDVITLQEGCAFLVELNIYLFKTKEFQNQLKNKAKNIELLKIDKGDYEVIPIIDAIPQIVYLDAKFFKYYNGIKSIKINLKGKFKKKLVCEAPKPILKNICRVK